MNVNKTDDLVFRVIGAAMTLHNTIGHGLREKTYERALVVELNYLDIAVDQQSVFPIVYRNVKIDEFILDLVVSEHLIVDTKVIQKIDDNEIGQILNYLKITGKKTGLVLNFKNPKLEWRKVTLQNPISNSRSLTVKSISHEPFNRSLRPTRRLFL